MAKITSNAKNTTANLQHFKDQRFLKSLSASNKVHEKFPKVQEKTHIF